MKLGTQTGSVMNHLKSRATQGQPKPAVGMPATVLAWTDRYAATITEVVEVKPGVYRIAVQRDTATRVDRNGMSEDQDYVYARNENGRIEHFMNKGGPDSDWRRVVFNEQTRRWNVADGNGLRIGSREEYRDPSF